jgi:hypothetical protein
MTRTAAFVTALGLGIGILTGSAVASAQETDPTEPGGGSSGPVSSVVDNTTTTVTGTTSKMMSTLSNLLKKISDTASSIGQNLK